MKILIHRILIAFVVFSLCSLPTVGYAQKPGEKKPGEQANGGEDKKPDGEKGTQDKKEEEKKPTVIKRTDTNIVTDSKPIEAVLDENGKVTFNFQGVGWLPVLNWLAQISGLSLDWQELPGDYLNLRTQQAYSALEARDLINRHLLLRGYTLLQDGELLTVAKISTLDPGLVPRVLPEELAERMPHEYVKVSMPLNWLLAADAVEDLKPMLSPNGKLSAIKSVNRLEAMDAAINLREIYALLRDEQSGSSQEKQLVKEFKLKYVRANNVIDLLYGILGLDKPTQAQGDISNMMGQQIMQQLQRMQQQQSRGNDGGGSGDDGKPRLVVNVRENSILAHATPDKMEIISETIAALDVAPDDEMHLLQNFDRMRVYRLSTLDPEPLLKVLEEMGGLSPLTKIQVDKTNDSLIVYGELADHVTVQSLVDRLDGSSRSFEVIALRKLQAPEVAGTIQYILGEEEKEESNNSRYSYRYYGYGYGGGNDSNQKDERPFRVEADVEYNRLLVWANEVELKEIENLLVKMGETPPGKSNPETLRVIDVYSDEEAAKLLQKLRQTWPNIAPNRLEIQGSEEASPEAAPPDERVTPSEAKAPKSTAAKPVPLRRALFAEAPHPLAVRPEVPPIVIRRLPDGRIMLGSPDTAALDQLEEIIGELAPQQPDYKIFKLQYAHTWAYGIEMILTDIFKDDANKENFVDWWGNIVENEKSSPSRLSKKRPIRFISDEDSRTILVQGGTQDQLAMVEELIKIYDIPQSADPQAVRQTKIFPIEHSKANVVAETVKAVYRDLLSSNDPSLQQQNQKNAKPEQSYTYVYGGGGNGGDDREAPQQIRFKGLLSVGVDEISNTVVVSAASGLMEDISQLIQVLDEAARPTTKVQVMQLPPTFDLSMLKDRLDGAFGNGGKVNVSSTGGSRSPRNNRPERNQPQVENNSPGE